MRVLQINARYPNGSTGANTRDLHRYLLAHGHGSYVAALAFRAEPERNFYKIGTLFGRRLHSLRQRITGYQAHGSALATRGLCRWIDRIEPDVIHLQNVHSHFLNLPMLLDHIAARQTALCMTLHDCWFFTGGCVHYAQSGCGKWQTGCGGCPEDYYGIRSWFFDRSAETARDRRDRFAAIKRLGVIGVSDWVLGEAKRSYIFKDHPTVRWRRIYNWIDDTVFRPVPTADLRAKLGIPEGGKMILGVATPWNARKGLDLFLNLAPLLNDDERIVLIGPKPNRPLPKQITAVGRIANTADLVACYAAADVFVQGSKEETFGKVTAEALFCGTPAAAYDMTANSELIAPGTGALIPPDADAGRIMAILRRVMTGPKPAEACRQSALDRFTMESSLPAHLKFYAELTAQAPEPE